MLVIEDIKNMQQLLQMLQRMHKAVMVVSSESVSGE
jgi:hypothetical protein